MLLFLNMVLVFAVPTLTLTLTLTLPLTLGEAPDRQASDRRVETVC